MCAVAMKRSPRSRRAPVPGAKPTPSIPRPPRRIASCGYDSPKVTSCSSAFLDVLEGFKSALSRATVVDNRRRVSPAETNSHVREIYRLGFPFMLLWDHLEQMHGVGREQADRCERKTARPRQPASQVSAIMPVITAPEARTMPI